MWLNLADTHEQVLQQATMPMLALAASVESGTSDTFLASHLLNHGPALQTVANIVQQPTTLIGMDKWERSGPAPYCTLKARLERMPSTKYLIGTLDL